MMAPDKRVSNAFSAMRALGIPDKEVKPVLKKLLKVYDRNWELIEEDNYRTLVDAYFEFNEDKGVEGKRKAPMFHEGCEGPSHKLHLADEEDQGSSIMDNSSQMILIEENEIPPETIGQEIIESSQPSIRDIGSQPLHAQLSGIKKPSLPHGVATARKPNPERASSAVHVKEPSDKASYANMKREIMPSNYQNKNLIKPKTEKSVNNPPLAPVVLSYQGSAEASTGNHHVKSLSTLYLDIHKDDSSPCNDYQCCKTNIYIASSHLGEVKFFLNCDCALGQPDFQIPKLDTVIKFMEENYLRTYKTEFSMIKVLKDLCDSYLTLGMKSSQKGPNYQGHTNPQNSMVPQQQVIANGENRDFHVVNDIAKGAERVKIPLVHDFGNKNMPKFNYISTNIIYQSANINISLARIADEDCCLGCSGDCLSSSITCACARETGGEFAYNPQGLLKEEFLRACISLKREPQGHHYVYCQDCPLERSKDGYMPERCKGHLVRKFIKECWTKCGCDMQCGNRVVQRGLRWKLQVFLTHEGKGWGLRVLEDLPKGSFVCEYVGEILTNMELYERNMQKRNSERHTYPVTLDADWGSERVLRDEDALCLDATYHGNAARFINHRCSDANLVDIPVEVETPDRHYYHLAFFTSKKISAFEELTWDYGIDFDDHDHPIKAFQCCCGSTLCRDKKRKGKRKIEEYDKRPERRLKSIEEVLNDC
ncbi:Histone-lysine N-methyltransferase [Quillaja saponaria]|uniref:Histone-lysine N-methyltransferase n=1 Tax=Quillaja saponaria TaxID=32244 RepID=A0AAD7Q287_QUISA|nr:Histone-lysine N-methyltransferase [Quillaja saponaria]KAJ7973534.1 Histone-lysine N-methyltransferase [Quillaja saponaria]